MWRLHRAGGWRNPIRLHFELAARVDGKTVETIESLADNGRLSRLQKMFHEKLGTQCGLLYAGHDHGIGGTCCGPIRSHPTRRSGRRWRGTSVALHGICQDYRISTSRLR